MKHRQGIIEKINDFKGSAHELHLLLEESGGKIDQPIVDTCRKLYNDASDNSLKLYLKNLLKLADPDFAAPPSGLLFPGNFTLSEIKQILAKIDERELRDFSPVWNRFEINRILNAVSNQKRENMAGVFKPFLSWFSSFPEYKYEQLEADLKLMDAIGEITIKNALSNEEKAQYEKETKDFWSDFYTQEKRQEILVAELSRYERPVRDYEGYFSPAPEFKTALPLPYYHCFRQISEFQRRYWILALEKYLPYLPDPGIRAVLQRLMDGGSSEAIMKLLDDQLQKWKSDLKHFLYYFETQFSLFEIGSPESQDRNNYRAYYPLSLKSKCSTIAHSSNREQKKELWLKVLESEEISLYRILEAVNHYPLPELVPELQKLYRNEKRYRIALKNFLEIKGFNEGIRKSALIFPGFFTLEEIRLILSLLSEMELHAFSVKWNWEERNQLLNAALNPETLFPLIRPRQPDTFFWEYIFKRSRKRLKEIIFKLEKAGKVTLRMGRCGKTPLENLDKKLSQELGSEKSLPDFDLPNEESVQKLIRALEQLPSSPLPSVENFQNFFEKALSIAGERGLMALEDYLPFLGDNYLRNMVQAFVDGLPTEDVLILIRAGIKRMEKDFDHFCSFIRESFVKLLDGISCRYFQDLLLAYYPELENEIRKK